MDNSALDKILTYLNEHLLETLYVSVEFKGFKTHFEFNPVLANYGFNGIILKDKHGNKIEIDDDMFEMMVDESYDVPQFSFRDKNNDTYISICL